MKDSYAVAAPVVDFGSGMCYAGFTRVVFPSFVVRPKMRCIMASMYQKDRHVTMLFVDSGRDVFPFVVCRPRCSASWPVWTRRTATS